MTLIYARKFESVKMTLMRNDNLIYSDSIQKNYSPVIELSFSIPQYIHQSCPVQRARTNRHSLKLHASPGHLIAPVVLYFLHTARYRESPKVRQSKHILQEGLQVAAHRENRQKQRYLILKLFLKNPVVCCFQLQEKKNDESILQKYF